MIKKAGKAANYRVVPLFGIMYFLKAIEYFYLSREHISSSLVPREAEFINKIVTLALPFD